MIYFETITAQEIATQSGATAEAIPQVVSIADIIGQIPTATAYVTQTVATEDSV